MEKVNVNERCGMTKRNDARTMIDLEVQRRLTDALASAGVPQGRLSLEVLYMLPPRFVRGYVKLFDTALEESIRSGSGSADGGRRSVKRTGALRDSGKGASRNADGTIRVDNRRAVVQPTSGGGKRWVRKHWSVRDEDALHVKDLLDRKLLRLIDTTLKDWEDIRTHRKLGLRDLNGGDDGTQGDDEETTYACMGCGMDHTPLVRLLSRMRDLGADAPLRHCPRCGINLG